MHQRDSWIALIPSVTAAEREPVPCPRCSKTQLDYRYIIDPKTRLGYLLLWCNACLHGITVSRVKAPAGVKARSMDDPRALTDVPEFTRCT
ncbi:hypothetical protein SAMN05428945_5351 [Streptomyces sp. 2224.1]|nr:hypothetical protein SAMN05428945_5351 [Streptomyces sp. 2224.1]